MSRQEEILTEVESLFEKEDYEAAIKILEFELERDGDNAVLYGELGMAYFAQEEYSKAKELFEKSTKTNPEYATTYYYKAVQATLEENPEEALDLVDKAIKLEPDNPDFLNYKSMLYTSQAKYVEAVQVLKTAVETITDNSVLYLNLAKLLSSMGENTQALDYVEQAINIEPDNHSLWAEKSIIEAHLSNLDKAAEAAKKAYELFPENRKYETAYNGLTGLYLCMEEKASEAIPYFERVVELEPSSQNYSYLAKAHMDNEEYDIALDLFNKTLEMDPENPEAALEKANLYKITKNGKEAIKAYQEFSKIVKRNNLEHYQTLAASIDHHYPLRKEE